MDKDLIAIIIAAVFGILSAIMSKKKKAMQQQIPPLFDSDPYETTQHPADNDFYGAEASVNSPQPDAGPWSYDSQIIDETTRQMPVDAKTEHNAMNKPGKDIKTYRHKQNTEATEGEGMEMLYSESEKTGILGDFNLRDAIIYSELLKPKFED